MENLDPRTVEGFGDEWSRFDQSRLSAAEARALFDRYFIIFPWDRLPSGAVGFDAGCGSGRWARFVAERVGALHCVDASSAALAVARRNLAERPNCCFHLTSINEMPLAAGSMDFGYSLGVLHHIPDTVGALRACVEKLKPGAPFLVYLYYALDNRPSWFRMLWRLSNAARVIVSRLPLSLRYAASQLIAALVYYPFARMTRALERLGMRVRALPLSAYRHATFYTMRTDALDRFGTRLEHRFSAREIESMLRTAGLTDIVFSPNEPFWCALGYRRR